MKKSVDTQYLSARQILLLAPAASPTRALILQVLRPPRYVVLPAEDPDAVVRMVADHKIEVVVMEPEAGRTRSPAVMNKLRDADPHAQVVVLAPRAALAATVLALQGPEGGGRFDVLGAPFSAAELLQAVEHAREIRYLRRADERGRRAEARMGAIVRSAPNAIVSLDAAGVIHDWNPAAESIFGWSAAEAVGRAFWELALARPAGGPPLVDEASAHKAVRAEIDGRRRDGTAFPAVISLSLAATAEQPMYCAIIEDVTDARRLELELRHAQKLEAVGRLASGLAHEINTPCQIVASHAQLVTEAFAAVEEVLGAYEALARRAAEAAEAATLTPAIAAVAAAEEASDLAFLRERVPRALAGIEEGGRRIARIVAAMKDFARPDVRERVPVDLNQSLTSTLTVLESETRDVADVVTDFGAIPPVSGYAGDLNQAFLQILRNAVSAVSDCCKQTGARGLITVRTRAAPGNVTVDIGDTGVGIPEAIRPRIFDPFFTTREVGAGAGQGLSVARAVVVDWHGGALTFESAVGVGTTFSVRLPLLAAAAAAAVA